MANIVSGLKVLLTKKKIDKVWLMKPIASLTHDKFLFIVFHWESNDTSHYALNVRDASNGVALASEMVNPILIDEEIILKAYAESTAEQLNESDTEVNIICHVLGSVDLKAAFAKKGSELPSEIVDLFNQAISVDESAELEEFVPLASNQEVRVRKSSL